MVVKAKKFIFQKQFDGFPKPSDFKLVVEDLPPIKDGEFLAEAVYLSVDPYMRAYSATVPIGATYIGIQVAKIIESKNPDFPVGRHVVGGFGWRSHTISDGAKLPGRVEPYLFPDIGDLPVSLAVGTLGMPGNTAYFGFLEICQPKQGETVVVSGAAGAVGSQVGQIAKIKGCKVIGIVGSDEKGKWITEELKFDHYINYKTDKLDAKLTEYAPEGVNCYFDNVGGSTTVTVIKHMNHFGRISVCGAISSYNERGAANAFSVPFDIVSNQLKFEGFLVVRWMDRWMEGINENLELIKEGKLQYRETVTEGFENMVKAFCDMLKGVNFGKAVVKA